MKIEDSDIEKIKSISNDMKSKEEVNELIKKLNLIEKNQTNIVIQKQISSIKSSCDQYIVASEQKSLKMINVKISMLKRLFLQIHENQLKEEALRLKNAEFNFDEELEKLDKGTKSLKKEESKMIQNKGKQKMEVDKELSKTVKSSQNIFDLSSEKSNQIRERTNKIELEKIDSKVIWLIENKAKLNKESEEYLSLRKNIEIVDNSKINSLAILAINDGNIELFDLIFSRINMKETNSKRILPLIMKNFYLMPRVYLKMLDDMLINKGIKIEDDVFSFCISICRVDLIEHLLKNYSERFEINVNHLFQLISLTHEDKNDVFRMLLKKLVSSNVNINELNFYKDKNIPNDNKTLLYIAAENGLLDLSKVLLEASSNPDISNYWNVTPLEIAIINNYTALANLLEDFGATGDKNWAKAMCFLANDSLSLFKQHMVDKKVDPNDKKHSSWSFLFMAISTSRYDFIYFLIDEMNAIPTLNELYAVIIYDARSNNSEEPKNLFKRLIEKSSITEASINMKFGNDKTLLYKVSKYGLLELCKQLILSKADSNIYCTKHKIYPIEIALENGHEAIFNYLKDYSEKYDEVLFRAFYLVKKQDEIKLKKLLDNKTIDLNRKNVKGFSIIETAIMRENYDIVVYLCSMKKILELDIVFFTLDYNKAPSHASKKIIDFLVNCFISREESKNTINQIINGTTLLCLAAEKGYEDICIALLKANADVNIIDVHGNKVVNYAIEKGMLNLYQCIMNVTSQSEEHISNPLTYKK